MHQETIAPLHNQETDVPGTVQNPKPKHNETDEHPNPTTVEPQHIFAELSQITVQVNKLLLQIRQRAAATENDEQQSHMSRLPSVCEKESYLRMLHSSLHNSLLLPASAAADASGNEEGPKFLFLAKDVLTQPPSLVAVVSLPGEVPADLPSAETEPIAPETPDAPPLIHRPAPPAEDLERLEHVAPLTLIELLTKVGIAVELRSASGTAAVAGSGQEKLIPVHNLASASQQGNHGVEESLRSFPSGAMELSVLSIASSDATNQSQPPPPPAPQQQQMTVTVSSFWANQPVHFVPLSYVETTFGWTQREQKWAPMSVCYSHSYSKCCGRSLSDPRSCHQLHVARYYLSFLRKQYVHPRRPFYTRSIKANLTEDLHQLISFLMPNHHPMKMHYFEMSVTDVEPTEGFREYDKAFQSWLEQEDVVARVGTRVPLFVLPKLILCDDYFIRKDCALGSACPSVHCRLASAQARDGQITAALTALEQLSGEESVKQLERAKEAPREVVPPASSAASNVNPSSGNTRHQTTAAHHHHQHSHHHHHQPQHTHYRAAPHHSIDFSSLSSSLPLQQPHPQHYPMHHHHHHHHMPQQQQVPYHMQQQQQQHILPTPYRLPPMYLQSHGPPPPPGPPSVHTPSTPHQFWTSSSSISGPSQTFAYAPAPDCSATMFTHSTQHMTDTSQILFHAAHPAHQAISPEGSQVLFDSASNSLLYGPPPPAPPQPVPQQGSLAPALPMMYIVPTTNGAYQGPAQAAPYSAAPMTTMAGAPPQVQYHPLAGCGAPAAAAAAPPPGPPPSAAYYSQQPPSSGYPMSTQQQQQPTLYYIVSLPPQQQ